MHAAYSDNWIDDPDCPNVGLLLHTFLVQFIRQWASITTELNSMYHYRHVAYLAMQQCNPRDLPLPCMATRTTFGPYSNS